MNSEHRILQKIALVGPLPPPFGGMANQTLQLSKLLQGEGIQVRLIRTNAPYRPAWAEKLQGIRALFRLVPYIFDLWRGVKGADVVHLMANSGWSWHLFAAPAIWIAYLRAVPVIVNYRGGEAEAFLNRSAPAVRISLNRVSDIVVPSGYLQSVFKRFQIETRIVPNIIDLGRFTSNQSKALNSQAPHFIVCRNLEGIYDNATAIRAFSRILPVFPGARLTIAGEGPERPALERLVAELGIDEKVRFAGRLDVAGMIELYRSADVMLNASRVDNMPNALLEAMSMGLPIVTSDAGGIPYMVDDGKTALVVPVGDWEGMADAALRLLADAALYTALSNNGRREVMRYQWESVWPLWSDLYTAVCR